MLIRENYYEQRRSRIHELVLEILEDLDEMIVLTDKYLLTSSEEAKDTVLNIEDTINSHESKIEKYILEMVSLEQLNKIEINWIFSMSRIIRELERVGDQIVNVLTMSDIFEKQAIQPRINDFFHYQREMIEFLSQGIDDDDVSKLSDVINHDQYINKLEDKTMNQALNVIKRETSITESQLKIVMISRFLERIGDHLGNAAKVYKESIKYKQSKSQ